MPVITLNSIRGGSGTTSCAVGLAWALQTLDESVLIVDLSPSNLLHLHFNGKLNDHRGWAKGLLDSQKWHHNAFEYTPLLTYLPFGDLSVNERIKLKVLFEQNPLWWQQQVLRIASKKYRWIIFDKPQLDYWAEQPISIVSDCELCVLNADAACHALLHQDLLEHQVETDTLPNHQIDTKCFLLNKFLPNSQLQQDIQQLWQFSLDKLVPITLHRDEAMAEALAQKQPVGEYAPYSLVAEEMITLANWLLIHYSNAR